MIKVTPMKDHITGETVSWRVDKNGKREAIYYNYGAAKRHVFKNIRAANELHPLRVASKSLSPIRR